MIQILSYNELMKIRQAERYYSKKEFEEAKVNPILVHMTNSFMIVNRPWNEVTNHFMKHEYEKYALLTPWKSEPFDKDQRTIKKRIIDFCVKMMPRKILTSIVSYIYNVTRVNHIRKQCRKYAAM